MEPIIRVAQDVYTRYAGSESFFIMRDGDAGWLVSYQKGGESPTYLPQRGARSISPRKWTPAVQRRADFHFPDKETAFAAVEAFFAPRGRRRRW